MSYIIHVFSTTMHHEPTVKQAIINSCPLGMMVDSFNDQVVISLALVSSYFTEKNLTLNILMHDGRTTIDEEELGAPKL